MKNKFFKSIVLVFLVVLFRSIYLQQNFYLNIWKENKITILFVGSLFAIAISVIIFFQKTETSPKDID